MKEKIFLRRNAKHLEPIVRIGKSGISENMVEEINKNLKKRKLIKIKFLASSLKGDDKKKLINLIAHKTNSEIIESVGNIVVLYKR
jgi:RNA-binding protein